MATRDDAGEQVGEWSQLLLEQARLSEGTLPADPAGFARKIASLMGKVAEQESAG